MDKEIAKKLLRQRLIADNPEMANVFAMQDLKESMDDKNSTLAQNLQLENMLERMKTRGDNGYSPVKGKDYFDGENGKDGEEGEQGPQGEKGDKGDKGDRGSSGVDGVNGLNGKDGSPDTPEMIAEKLNTLEGAIDITVIKGALTIEDIKGQLDISDIKNWNQPAKGKLDQRWHGGGISSVSHDTTLTGLGTPSSPLSVVSSSGLVLETNGTPNGSQTLLNLVQGTNVTITDDGVGNITIDSTGGSGNPGGSDGQIQYNNSGSFGGDTATTDGSGNWSATSLTLSGLTASQIVATNGSSELQTLTTATYPSLTELSYVKGVTSAIQTQLNSKQATLTIGDLTDVGTDGITIGNGSGAVIGSGTTISQHVADSSHNGYLSSTDWSTFNGKGSGTVTSVSGTANRITSTGGATPVIDISASYVGQSSITTLGTIATGVWQGTAIGASYIADLSATYSVKAGNTSLVTTGDITTGRFSFVPASSGGTTKGSVITLTSTETQAVGDVVQIDSSGHAHLAKADVIADASVVLLAAAAVSGSGSNTYLLPGGTCKLASSPSWTVGGLVYLSTTGTTTNTLTQTPPSSTNNVIQVVGVALAADVLLFLPSLSQVEHT